MNGKQLGPYRILDKLGEGGMGEVYRARDTRLGRDVAIKVLPAHLAADPDARARFEREARAISSLNHPHICALYDVGRETPPGARNPVDFLVMELLEGEPLSDRLTRGPLPLPEVLRVAAQIADALDKAHRKGFVHRDLKPANVMLNKAGAKLLDFGLARHITLDAPGAAPPVTVTREVSGTSIIAGTFHYMAPEQIEGREADARTDIWALGATLFEMTTASRPFDGTSTASLMSAILRDEPPRVRTAQPLTPPALDRLINRCLAKDPDDRWQSAADLKHELLWIAQSGGESPAPTAVPPRPIRASSLWWPVTAALTAAAGLAGWWLAPRQTPPSAPVVRAAVALPPGDGLPRNDLLDLSQTLALARDGRFVAYSTDGAESRLVLRALDTGESRVLASANTMGEPFFSPDGRFLAFVSGSGGSNRPGSPGVGGELRTVSVGGGAPVTLVRGVFTSKGGSWGDDGLIYYSPAPAAGLWRVRQEGGAPERLTTPDRARGEKTHRRPFLLPGSKALLFVVGTGRIASFDDARIEALSLADRARHPLIQGGTAPSYLPSGHLLYARGDKLLAVRFDPDRLEMRGAPVTVLDGVEHWPASGVSQYAVSSTGSLIYNASRGTAPPSTLFAYDRQGGVTKVADVPSRTAIFFCRVSPDGTRAAIDPDGATQQLDVIDLAQNTSVRLTYDWDNSTPVWSPDGKRLFYRSNRDGEVRNIYAIDAGGSGSFERVTNSPHEQTATSAWGRLLAYDDVDPDTLTDVWVMSLDTRASTPLARTPSHETAARFSPDGRWLAYQSNQSGPWEVYVQPYPPDGRRWQVSRSGGVQPMWSKHGELLYRRGTDVMITTVHNSPERQNTAPRKLLTLGASDLWQDMMPDGRLLIVSRDRRPPVTSLELIVNWLTELNGKTQGQ